MQSTLARRAVCLRRAAPTTLRTPAGFVARPLSTSQSLRSASSHEDHYDPPGGWLWGQDPSKQHQKEDWENVFTYGFFGAMAFLVVGYCYKPDTRYVLSLAFGAELYLGFRNEVRRGTWQKLERRCERTMQMTTRLTGCSIQTWALEEARRRLEAEGILADPEK